MPGLTAKSRRQRGGQFLAAGASVALDSQQQRADEDSEAGGDACGYWRELPPGVYSLRLTVPATASESGSDAGSACQTEPGRPESTLLVSCDDQNENVSSPLMPLAQKTSPPALLPLAMLTFHDWCNPLLLELSAYERPTLLTGAAGQAEASNTVDLEPALPSRSPQLMEAHAQCCDMPMQAHLAPAMSSIGPHVLAPTTEAPLARISGVKAARVRADAVKMGNYSTSPATEALALRLLAVLTTAVEVRILQGTCGRVAPQLTYSCIHKVEQVGWLSPVTL